jgi:hypothetical protein
MYAVYVYLGLGLQLFLSLVATRTLSINDRALLGLVTVYFLSFNQLIGLGLPNAFLRYGSDLINSCKSGNSFLLLLGRLFLAHSIGLAVAVALLSRGQSILYDHSYLLHLSFIGAITALAIGWTKSILISISNETAVCQEKVHFFIKFLLLIFLGILQYLIMAKLHLTLSFFVYYWLLSQLLCFAWTFNMTIRALKYNSRFRIISNNNSCNIDSSIGSHTFISIPNLYSYAIKTGPAHIGLNDIIPIIPLFIVQSRDSLMIAAFFAMQGVAGMPKSVSDAISNQNIILGLRSKTAKLPHLLSIMYKPILATSCLFIFIVLILALCEPRVTHVLFGNKYIPSSSFFVSLVLLACSQAFRRLVLDVYRLSDVYLHSLYIEIITFFILLLALTLGYRFAQNLGLGLLSMPLALSIASLMSVGVTIIILTRDITKPLFPKNPA